MKKILIAFASLSLLLPALPLSAQTQTVSVCPTITRTLYFGISGEDVSALQRYLARDSSVYPLGVVSGYFGLATRAAVQRWQDVQGIAKPGQEGSGTVGPRTRAALAACGATQSAVTTTKTAAPASDLTCNLSVSPGSIRQGERATLFGKAGGGVRRGTIEGVGSVAAVGSTTVSPSVSTAYAANFEGPPGYSVACRVQLFVYTPTGAPTTTTTPAASSTATLVPAIRFFKSDTSVVKAGGAALLSWDTENAHYCILESKPLSGGFSTFIASTTKPAGSLAVSVSQPTYYTFACYTPTGSTGPYTVATLGVGVPASAGAGAAFPSLSLKAEGFEESVTLPRNYRPNLEWTARNVKQFSCGVRTDAGTLVGAGEFGKTVVSAPATSTTYTLSCEDAAGLQYTDNVRINVR